MAREQGKTPVRDEGVNIFGASVLLKHVLSLQQEISEIQAEKDDIEYIHRARVASRRLRSAMTIFSTCLPKKRSTDWEKQIRVVTQALGEARDTDVQIERLNNILKEMTDKRCHPGINRLILRREQRRKKIQPDVLSAVKMIQEQGLLDEMSERFSAISAQSSSVYMYTPALYQHSRQSIATRLDEFLAYEIFINQPDRVKELHEMRIKAKWLRYTVESFSSLYSDELKSYLQVIRKVQDLLGDIHDCDVWSDYLPKFLEAEQRRCLEFYGHTRFFGRLAPGIQAFCDNRAAQRNNLYDEFINDWQKWQAEQIWEMLIAGLQSPFPKPEAIFPPAMINTTPTSEANS